MSETIQVLIAQNRLLLQKGTQGLLSDDDGIQIVSCVQSIQDALSVLHQKDVDVLLTGTEFGDGDGIDLHRKSVGLKPGLRSLCLSHCCDPVFMHKAARAGMHGFVYKNCELETLGTLIRGVCRDRYYFDSDIMLESHRPGGMVCRKPLSMRETQIIRHIANGLSSREIAETLHLSYYTIETHRKNIYGKLRVKNIGELLKAARNEGHID